MAQEKVSMRKIREILRLKQAMLERRGCVVYVAASELEADRLWDEVGVEMVVWDPVFRVVGE